MKPYHDNNGATIYVERTETVHNPLLYRSHYSWISFKTEMFLLVSCSNIYCGLCTVKAKNANKKYNKEVCQASQPLPFINYGESGVLWTSTPFTTPHPFYGIFLADICLFLNCNR